MNWWKRNAIYAWTALVFCLGSLWGFSTGLTAHAQKPHPNPTITWATNVNAGYVLFLAKDGTMMFSESGMVSDAKAVATNVRCDPDKSSKGDGWHGCKAEPIKLRCDGK